MPGKNLIVASNPAPRRKTRRKTRRTAAQKAASRRNIKKAQRARRRPARRATTRRRRTTARRAYRRRSNPVRKFSVERFINNQVMPAAIGGAGAVLDDLLVNLVPMVPADWKIGWRRHVLKVLGAVTIGYVGGMFLPRRTADQLAAGAMIVTGYNVVREVAARAMPNVPLGEYLPMGEYLDADGLGFYGAGLNPSAAQLSTSHQFTRGTPYIDPDGLGAWPTNSSYDGDDQL